MGREEIMPKAEVMLVHAQCISDDPFELGPDVADVIRILHSHEAMRELLDKADKR